MFTLLIAPFIFACENIKILNTYLYYNNVSFNMVIIVNKFLLNYSHEIQYFIQYFIIFLVPLAFIDTKIQDETKI